MKSWYCNNIYCLHKYIIVAVNFYLWQGSEYSSTTKYAMLLNIPWLHKVLNMSECAWIMPWYAWLCQNMREYACICLNGFCCTCHYCNSLSTWICVVTYCNGVEGVWTNMRLFSWRDKIWFFLLYLEVSDLLFAFRLNFFTSKIYNFLLSLGDKVAGDCESWYTKFQYSIVIWSIMFCVSNQSNLNWNWKYLSCLIWLTSRNHTYCILKALFHVAYPKY